MAILIIVQQCKSLSCMLGIQKMLQIHWKNVVPASPVMVTWCSAPSLVGICALLHIRFCVQELHCSSKSRQEHWHKQLQLQLQACAYMYLPRLLLSTRLHDYKMTVILQQIDDNG